MSCHSQEMTPMTCSFTISRKKRNCKMRVYPGAVYCAQHLSCADHTENTSVTRRRIPCPLDSKHNCFQDELEKHLMKCNAREKAKPIYYQKNINSGPESTAHIRIPLKDVPDSTLMCLVQKIEKAFFEMRLSVEQEINTSRIVDPELNNASYGPSVLKHLKQNASLLGILEKYHLLQDDTCFIEFGAGRGQLSHWLIQASKQFSSNSFVLIDRASQRHKFDNRYKDETGPEIIRIKVDIEHLNLGYVNTVKNSKQVVAVSKHLCGAGTDLTLQCLMNFCNMHITLSPQAGHGPRSTVKGILLAMCCHHECTLSSYVGKKYLEQWGFDEDSFNILTSIASWATCGSRKRDPVDNPRYRELNLPRHRRDELGFKCKMILNFGRTLFLKENNYNARLLYYIQNDISLENVAILALYDTNV